MIEQATVDAYGDSEQITGWFTMIEENLAVQEMRNERVSILRVAGHRPAAHQEEMATLLCGSQSKNCWHVLIFAPYRILIPTGIPTAT